MKTNPSMRQILLLRPSYFDFVFVFVSPPRSLQPYALFEIRGCVLGFWSVLIHSGKCYPQWPL